MSSHNGPKSEWNTGKTTFNDKEPAGKRFQSKERKIGLRETFMVEIWLVTALYNA